MIINYDKYEDWLPDLNSVLANKNVKYDQWDYFKFSDEMVCDTQNWITNNDVLVFHGTRLDDISRQRISTNGLKLGTSEFRKTEIQRALCDIEENSKLEEAIRYFNSSESANYFDGRVYFCLSRKTFLGRNLAAHFCEGGSEFDRAVVRRAFGEQGLSRLKTSRDPYIVHIKVPGELLFSNSGQEDVRYTCSVFLDIWALTKIHGKSEFPEGGVNWGKGVQKNIPPKDILKIEKVK